MEKHLELMKRSVETGELLEIYTNRDDTERFNVGRVLAMDESWYAVSYVCSDGRKDGIGVKQLDEIFMVCAETEYVKCVALLEDSEHCDFSPESGADLRMQLLEYAAARGKAVRVELLDSDNWDATGFVQSADEEGVMIRCLTNEGRPDGVSAFSSENITEIACDSEDERKIVRLAEARKVK